MRRSFFYLCTLKDSKILKRQIININHPKPEPSQKRSRPPRAAAPAAVRSSYLTDIYFMKAVNRNSAGNLF